jgi:hypothetical protein
MRTKLTIRVATFRHEVDSRLHTTVHAPSILENHNKERNLNSFFGAFWGHARDSSG